MKIRHVAAVSLAAVGLLFGGNGIANADANSFLNDVQALGFSNSDGSQAELSVGQTVCAELKAGVSEDAVAYDLWRKSGIDSQIAAQVFVEIAIADLCSSPVVQVT